MKILTPFGAKTVSYSLLREYRKSEIALREYFKEKFDNSNEYIVAGSRIHEISCGQILAKTDSEKKVLDKINQERKKHNMVAHEQFVKCNFPFDGKTYDGFGMADLMSHDGTVIADIKTYSKPDDEEQHKRKIREKTKETIPQIQFYQMMIWRENKILPKKGLIIFVPMVRDDEGNLVAEGEVETTEIPLPDEEMLNTIYIDVMKDLKRILEIAESL